ncbi:MAG: nucleotidyltransferase domain-containing protein [bacterium]
MEKAIERFAEKIKDSLADNIVSIELFGSKARGDFNKESDIDLLIVVNEKSPAVREKIFDIMFEVDPWYELMLSPRIMSIKEYQVNKAIASPFIEHIEREGIKL